MRNLIILLLCIAPLSTFSQNTIEFGVKAGLNYNSNGDFEAISDFDEFYIFEPTGRVGYHVGVLSEIGFYDTPFYVRPELLYTHTKSTYKKFLEADYILNKIELPIILGVKALKIGRIFAGPSFQYIYDSKFSNVSSDNIETDNLSLALHLGIGIQVQTFGFDIRWEKGLSENKTLMFEGRNILDAKSNQLIFSVSYKFIGGKK